MLYLASYIGVSPLLLIGHFYYFQGDSIGVSPLLLIGHFYYFQGDSIFSSLVCASLFLFSCLYFLLSFSNLLFASTFCFLFLPVLLILT